MSPDEHAVVDGGEMCGQFAALVAFFRSSWRPSPSVTVRPAEVKPDVTSDEKPSADESTLFQSGTVSRSCIVRSMPASAAYIASTPSR